MEIVNAILQKLQIYSLKGSFLHANQSFHCAIPRSHRLEQVRKPVQRTFAVNEVRIGVIPAVISVILLRKLTMPVAMELFLTGEAFDGTRAAEIGLLNRAVPAGDLDAAAERYLAQLRLGAPGALGGAKRLVREVPALGLHEGFEAMAALSASYFASPEALEGMTAFAEKRPPSWAKPD